jgi:3-hydroxyacyl-CoA dehydrogenase
MGGGIAALAASAGVPVVLLDVPASEGGRGGDAVARNGLERAKKSRPAAFMDPERAGHHPYRQYGGSSPAARRV